MANWLIEEFGPEILTKNGVQKTEDVLGGKRLIALSFSAHWCPPCRSFTPVLVDFYNQVKALGPDELEVVFVSSDQDQAQFDGYYASMTYTALPFDNRALKQKLGDKYGVRGIPTLIVLDGRDGHVVDAAARGSVSSHASNPKAALDEWAKL